MSYEQHHTYTDPYQVRVQPGTLITCDSAAKQILLHLDAKRKRERGLEEFVIHDVDETHLLIKTKFLDHVRDALQEELEKNTFVAGDIQA